VWDLKRWSVLSVVGVGAGRKLGWRSWRLRSSWGQKWAAVVTEMSEVAYTPTYIIECY